jgi:CRP/FNR family cyclic AMP-dependent transcriptional regulator
VETTTNQGAAGLNSAPDEILANLPLTTYRAGETVLTAGSRSGRLLILKAGAVVILKDSMEIARVEEPGAVFGELSALLDQPHTADVRTLQDSQFYIADATLPGKDPVLLLHIAIILAQRIVSAIANLLELRKQIRAGQSPSVLSKMLEKIETVLSIGGASFET